MKINNKRNKDFKKKDITVNLNELLMNEEGILSISSALNNAKKTWRNKKS